MIIGLYIGGDIYDKPKIKKKKECTCIAHPSDI
jgi:hypothetical protein